MFAKTIRQDRTGSVAVEFALIAPIMVAIFGIAVDLGRVMYDAMSVSAAARAAAEYARAMPDDAAGIQAAALAGGGLSATAVVSVSSFCECPNRAVVACTDTCLDGEVIKFVAVSVSQNFQTIVPYPGLPDPIPLQGQAVLRTS